jgi:hypothetical protein
VDILAYKHCKGYYVLEAYIMYVLYVALLISSLFSPKACMDCVGALTILTFWAQMALALLIAISGPKKVLIVRAQKSLEFQGPSLPMALL